MNWIGLFFGAFLILECNSQGVQQIAQATDKLSVKIFNLLKPSPSNFVFSGFSVEIICSLIANGAKGQTQSELLTTCALPTNQQTRDQVFKQLITELTVNTATLKLLPVTRMYPANKFVILPAYKSNALNFYKTEIQSLNYQNTVAAATNINSLFQSRTNNLIKNIVNPAILKPTTQLLVANLIYISGQWAIPFPKANTKKATFNQGGSRTKSIDFMTTTANVKYAENVALKAEFLELDLKNSDISVVIILPKTVADIKEIENNIAKYLAVQNLQTTAVKISLPKFSISTVIDDPAQPKQLGVVKFFTQGADLTGIAQVGQLHGDLLVQKSVITVTEGGINLPSENGVVTGSPVPQAKRVFNADRPFVFYIKDKSTKVQLFLGRFGG